MKKNLRYAILCQDIRQDQREKATLLPEELEKSRLNILNGFASMAQRVFEGGIHFGEGKRVSIRDKYRIVPETIAPSW